MSLALHCGHRLQAPSWVVLSEALQVPLRGDHARESWARSATVNWSVICITIEHKMKVKLTFGSLNAFGTL
jgi:hypothetical protein